jgi:hypothetical protein
VATTSSDSGTSKAKTKKNEGNKHPVKGRGIKLPPKSNNKRNENQKPMTAYPERIAKKPRAPKEPKEPKEPKNIIDHAMIDEIVEDGGIYKPHAVEKLSFVIGIMDGNPRVLRKGTLEKCLEYVANYTQTETGKSIDNDAEIFIANGFKVIGY